MGPPSGHCQSPMGRALPLKKPPAIVRTMCSRSVMSTAVVPVIPVDPTNAV